MKGGRGLTKQYFYSENFLLGGVGAVYLLKGNALVVLFSVNNLWNNSIFHF